jgi:hypothetical protein
MIGLNCDLSFDPQDPYFPVAGASVHWALQVFTTQNGYGLDGGRSTEMDVDGAAVRVTEGYARLGQQATFDAGRVSVAVRRTPEGWTFDIEVTHEEPVKSVKLILRGLPDEALSRGWWSPTTPRGTVEHPPLQWNYPSDRWATRWAAAGGLAISIDSSTVSGAVLHVDTPPYGDEIEVELVHSVPASEWTTSVTVPTIRLAIGHTEDAALRDFAVHHRRVRNAFGIPSWEERSDLPDWARHLERVVTLHGQHWTGHVFHDFADMGRLLERVAEVVDPSTVLAYLPGWEGRYYHEYPLYHPSPELGGEAGFARLADTAHHLGFRLMPMFGAHGANIQQYPRWEDAAVRNPSNRYPVMLNGPDWDGDRYPEGDQVFLNPGEPAYRAHLIESIAGIVDRFGTDAAFFDTASFWFDDPRYPMYQGFQEIVATLGTRFPNLLLVAEGWWDAMTALFPMSQQWLGVERDIRLPELLTDAARTTSHLAEGTPGLGSTGVHEQGFRPRPRRAALPGHLPVISFAGGDGAQQLEELRQTVADVPTRSGPSE